MTKILHKFSRSVQSKYSTDRTIVPIDYKSSEDVPTRMHLGSTNPNEIPACFPLSGMTPVGRHIASNFYIKRLPYTDCLPSTNLLRATLCIDLTKSPVTLLLLP